MRETGEFSAGSLSGNKLYEQRARMALPILVRQAKAGQTMLYGELADELLMPNPRNLNYVLGAIGNSMLDLEARWGKKVPPIQALVVNKGTHLPGEGISWFAPDAALFKRASRRQRKQIIDAMLGEVFMFRRWDEVLRALGLGPLPPPSNALPPIEEISRRGGAGEGNAHRRLKEAIAAHPEWLGLSTTLAPGETEVLLYSGDRVDVMFTNGHQRVAVEVKALDAAVSDLVRGVFQCVKYAAVLDAESRVRQDDIDSRAMLALGGTLPSGLAGLRAILAVDVKDGLGTGEV
jgi:hypothetical protein